MWSLHSCQVRLAVFILQFCWDLGNHDFFFFPGWSATRFLDDFAGSLLRLWRLEETFTLRFLFKWIVSWVHRGLSVVLVRRMGSWVFHLLHELARVTTLRLCQLSFRRLYRSSSIDKSWAKLKRKLWVSGWVHSQLWQPHPQNEDRLVALSLSWANLGFKKPNLFFPHKNDGSLLSRNLRIRWVSI